MSVASHVHFHEEARNYMNKKAQGGTHFLVRRFSGISYGDLYSRFLAARSAFAPPPKGGAKIRNGTRQAICPNSSRIGKSRPVVVVAVVARGRGCGSQGLRLSGPEEAGGG